jgi:hypothetical protein
MNSHVVPDARDGNGVEAKSACPGSQSGRPLVAKRVLVLGRAAVVPGEAAADRALLLLLAVMLPILAVPAAPTRALACRTR